MDAAVL